MRAYIEPAHCWACKFGAVDPDYWDRYKHVYEYEAIVEHIESMPPGTTFSIANLSRDSRASGQWFGYQMTGRVVRDMYRHGLLECARPSPTGKRCHAWRVPLDLLCV